MKETKSPRGWLERTALPAGLTLAHAAWIWPWSVLAGWWVDPEHPRPLLSLVSITTVLVVAWAVSRWSARRLSFAGDTGGGSVRTWPVRWLTVAVAFVTIALVALAEHGRPLSAGAFASLPAAIGSAVLGFFLWWKSFSRATWRGGIDGAESDFKTGLVGVAAFVVLSRAGTSGAGTLSAYRQATAASLMAFVFFGLTSLSLARLENAKARSLARSGRALPLSRYWLGFTVLTVIGLVIVTVAFTGLVSVGTLAAIVAAVVRPLQTVARLALYGVAYLIGFVLQGLVYAVRRLMHQSQSLPSQIGGDMSFLDQLRQSQATKSLPLWLVRGFEGAFTAAVLIMLAVWLARSVTRWQSAADDGEVEEERDSVWSWRPARGALRKWLASARKRLAIHRPGALTAGARATGRAAAPETPAATVRRVYRELLRLGQEKGWPRPAPATPDEYLTTIVKAGLGDAGDLAGLTSTYVKTRYSPHDPSPEEAQDAEERLRRVQTSPGP